MAQKQNEFNATIISSSQRFDEWDKAFKLAKDDNDLTVVLIDTEQFEDNTYVYVFIFGLSLFLHKGIIPYKQVLFGPRLLQNYCKHRQL